MKNLKSILTVLGIALLALSGYAQNTPSVDKSKFKLRWGVDKVKLYEHEPTLLTLYLWTPMVEARGVSMTKSPELDKGKFSYISHADFDRRMQVVDDKDGSWYVYPIDCYAITMDKHGKYNLKGGRYNVQVAVPYIYNDPFWGRMQSMTNEVIEIPVAPLEINITELPENKNADFSGAVGDFKVEVTVPPGKIYMNEEAIALVTVSGPGWINEHTLPEYQNAFGKGTKLKSFTEDRRQYIKNGEMVSEVQLECTFIPTSRENVVIGPVQMEFFNPKTGQYETVTSKDVKVKVESIAGKAPILDI